MKKEGWGDKQVEGLLRQMPRISDTRNPQDIYENISSKLNKKRRQHWIIPSLAAAAAMFLLFVLSPAILDSNNSQSQKTGNGEKSAIGSKASIENTAMLKKEQSTVVSDSSQVIVSEDLAVKKSPDPLISLYENEIGDGKSVTYWTPDKEVNFLVPVTVVLPGDNNKSWIENFNSTMNRMDDKEWGLDDDFYPLKATLTLEGIDSLVVDVLKDHPYKYGSSTEVSFLKAMTNNAASNSSVSKVKFTTEGTPGIVLGNLGEIVEEPVTPIKARAYFLFSVEGRNTPYLVPTETEFKNVDQALTLMGKGFPEKGFSPSIVPGLIPESIEADGNNLTLKLGSGSKLEENSANLNSIEAILITAKGFGFNTVTFKNNPVDFLGPFNLREPINVPAAPNKINP